jgi:hypothetical protein
MDGARKVVKGTLRNRYWTLNGRAMTLMMYLQNHKKAQGTKTQEIILCFCALLW